MDFHAFTLQRGQFAVIENALLGKNSMEWWKKLRCTCEGNRISLNILNSKSLKFQYSAHKKPSSISSKISAFSLKKLWNSQKLSNCHHRHLSLRSNIDFIIKLFIFLLHANRNVNFSLVRKKRKLFQSHQPSFPLAMLIFFLFLIEGN